MVTIIKRGASSIEIQRKIQKAFKGKGKLSTMDYAGLLKIDIDPLASQKQIRNEWT